MNLKRILFCLISFTVLTLLSGCGDQALFDELATNRIKVIIKGTYESNNPRDWETLDPLYFEENDSVYLLNNPSDDVKPTVFMLDVAGISVSSGKHSQHFANFRKTHAALLNDIDPFFNGSGILYDNDDVRPNFLWQNVNIYIRKMLFNNAKRYSITGVLSSYNDWGLSEDVIDLFHEEKVNGFNFNLAQVMSYSDSLRMNYLQVNRIFPLVIPLEDGFLFNNKDDETVLEIRLVVKNFGKKYEYEYVDADKNHKLIHYYALSDWLRNVKRNEPAPTSYTSGSIGGNLLAVARYYVPGKVASIAGASTGNCYVVASKIDLSTYLFDDPKRTRPGTATSSCPACDAPKLPRMPVLVVGQETNYLEALLQYYLQYETYKVNYDAFVTNLNLGTGTYETQWNDYDTRLNAFKIPQLVTWVPMGGPQYRLENVPTGTYNIYTATATIGSLPVSYSYVGTVTINESHFGIDVPGPPAP